MGGLRKRNTLIYVDETLAVFYVYCERLLFLRMWKFLYTTLRRSRTLRTGTEHDSVPLFSKVKEDRYTFLCLGALRHPGLLPVLTVLA